MRFKPLLLTLSRLNAALLASVLSMSATQAAERMTGLGELEAWLMPGMATGKLDWNIAASDGSPNVLSELIFDNLRTLTLEAGARFRFSNTALRDLQFRVSGRAGLIQDGNEHDRDWDGSNRTDLISYSRARVKSHRVDQAQVALGYTWFSAEPVSLTAYLGYEWNRQHLRITNGRQILDVARPSRNNTPIPGLHNRYNADWHSGWLGLETMWDFMDGHQLGAAVQYHHLWYQAEATWNLRPSFAQPDSFDHTASHGQGVRLHAHYRTELTSSLSLALQLVWECFEIDNGIDRLHLVSPVVHTEKSRLNEVKWRQSGVSTGLIWRF